MTLTAQEQLERKRTCNREYQRRRYQSDPEFRKKQLERSRKINATQKDEVKSYWQEYYKKHKEEILAKNRKWAKDNPEKATEISLKSLTNKLAKNPAYILVLNEYHRNYSRNYYHKRKTQLQVQETV